MLVLWIPCGQGFTRFARNDSGIGYWIKPNDRSE